MSWTTPSGPAGSKDQDQLTPPTFHTVFDSWAEGRIANNLGGEPAMSLVVWSPVLAGALELIVPDLFVYSLFLVMVSMPIATLAGIAHDVRDAPDTASLRQLTRPGMRRIRGVVR